MNMKMLYIAMHAMQWDSNNAMHAIDTMHATDVTHVLQKKNGMEASEQN